METLRDVYAGYQDEYTFQQLRTEFLTATPEGRIGLLEEFEGGVPTEIARLAAEDSDSRVRAWCAEVSAEGAGRQQREFSAESGDTSSTLQSSDGSLSSGHGKGVTRRRRPL